MRNERIEELKACCECIIRNAEKIASDFEFDQGFEVRIICEPGELMHCEFSKSFLPKEVIDSINKR